MSVTVVQLTQRSAIAVSAGMAGRRFFNCQPDIVSTVRSGRSPEESSRSSEVKVFVILRANHSSCKSFFVQIILRANHSSCKPSSRASGVLMDCRADMPARCRHFDLIEQAKCHSTPLWGRYACSMFCTRGPHALK